MYKILIGLLTMVFHLTSVAYCSNLKVLDPEAEAYTSKIWSKDPITEDDIKQSLKFFYNSKNIDEKYSNSNNFKNLCSTLKAEFQGLGDTKFSPFIEMCEGVYQSSAATSRTAIFILLEKVANKYRYDLKASRKLSPYNNPSLLENKDRERILKAFLNADKDITLEE